jgi:hypothetical protein
MMKTFAAFLLGLLCAGVGIWSFLYFHQGEHLRPVITQLRQLNQLETAMLSMETILDKDYTVTDDLPWLPDFMKPLGKYIPSGGDKYLFMAHGDAVAGFDFARLAEGDIQHKGESVTLKLPPPEIFSIRLDSARSKIYNRDRGTWAILTGHDLAHEDQIRRDAESALKSAACQSDLLTAAADSGRKQVTALLKGLGFTDVQIDIPAGKCATL